MIFLNMSLGVGPGWRSVGLLTQGLRPISKNIEEKTGKDRGMRSEHAVGQRSCELLQAVIFKIMSPLACIYILTDLKP